MKEQDKKKVIVAYSGGADSTCLLHWAAKKYQVVAAHLHHGIRKEADQDIIECQKLCEQLGIPLKIKYVDVPLLAKEQKLSVEEAARNARYSFFEEIREKFQAESILVGHTQDDHLETMLFQMVRGSGLKGLAGIPKKNGKIERPLWEWSRTQTEDYCKEKNLPFVKDTMNHDLYFSRVKIRKKVLPELLKTHPAARKSMIKLSQIAIEEDFFLDKIAHEAIMKTEKTPRFDYEKRFWREKLLELPLVILKRAVRIIAKEWGASLSFTLTDRIIEGLKTEKKGGINTEKNQICIQWDSNQLKFIRKSTENKL